MRVIEGVLGNSEYHDAENKLLFRETSARFGQKSQEGRKAKTEAGDKGTGNVLSSGWRIAAEPISRGKLSRHFQLIPPKSGVSDDSLPQQQLMDMFGVPMKGARESVAPRRKPSKTVARPQAVEAELNGSTAKSHSCQMSFTSFFPGLADPFLSESSNQ